MLYRPLFHHVKNQLSTNQHGFIKGKSTATNLLLFTQYVSGALDQRCQVDVIYADFSKAFDMVQHTIVFNKMRRFGISTDIVDLIKSYLSERRNYVEYRGVKSREYLSGTGVPQGSVLGPLLFYCLLMILRIIYHLQHCSTLMT